METPLIPCRLCDRVPSSEGTEYGWEVRCPICGRGAHCPTEERARLKWNEINLPRKPTRAESLELLDSIEDAMCDLEGLRTIPGAMDAWSRWMDDLAEIRRLVEEAGE